MLKKRILEELYEQVGLNIISQIKKGQVERWEKFFSDLLSEQESQKSAERMKALSEGREPGDAQENS